MASTARAARPGDLVLVVGAGDVTALAPLVLEALARRPGVTGHERPHDPRQPIHGDARRASRGEPLPGAGAVEPPASLAAGAASCWPRSPLPALLVWVVGWSTLLGVDESGCPGCQAPRRTPSRARRRARRAPRWRASTRMPSPPGFAGAGTVAEVSVRRVLAAHADGRRGAPDRRHRRAEPSRSTGGRGCDGGRVRDRPAAPPGVPVVTATGSEGTIARGAPRRARPARGAPGRTLRSDVSAVTVGSANLVTFTLGSRTVVWGGGERAGPQGRHPHGAAATKAKVIDVSAPDTPVTR